MLSFVNCNICNINNTKLIYQFNALKILKCKECGLVYVNPRLSKEEIKNIYNEQNRNLLPGESPRPRIPYFKTYFRNIEKYVKGKGKILELGFGSGFFLKIAKDEKWETYGVEASSKLHDFSSLEKEHNIFIGDLEEAKYPKDFFDVVVGIHVLEHLTDPFATLLEIYRILKKGGILFIEVPNFGGISSIIQRERWKGVNPRAHLYYFTPKTLSLLLNKTGFKTLKINTNIKATQIVDKKIWLAHCLNIVNFIIGKTNLGNSLQIMATKDR